MSAANDYSHLRVAIAETKSEHDYAAIMRYAQDERNWFKRARGEWADDATSCPHCAADDLH
jgi:hypothetical protein